MRWPRLTHCRCRSCRADRARCHPCRTGSMPSWLRRPRWTRSRSSAAAASATARGVWPKAATDRRRVRKWRLRTMCSREPGSVPPTEGRPTWSRSPHPGVRQPPVTAVESAAVLVESQHAVGGGVPDRRPHAAGLVRAFIPGQEGAAAIVPAGACPPSSGCRSPPSGRSGRTVRQLARCAQVRLEPAQARTYGSHACRSACMPRTVFTGRDLTQIAGRVEAQGLVGTSPDELGAGLPYG